MLDTIVSNIQETRNALKLWGQYMNAPVAGGSCRGYPNQSCVLSGGIDRHQKYAPVVSTPSNLVKKVDDAMKFLAIFDAVDFMALKYKYEDNYIDVDAAKEMNMSKKTYQIRVTNGERFVAGKIS